MISKKVKFLIRTTSLFNRETHLLHLLLSQSHTTMLSESTKRVSTRKRKSPDFFVNNKNTPSDNEEFKDKLTKKKFKPVVSELSPKEIKFDTSLVPKVNAKGELVFQDHPEFRPNLTPEEVIRRGSFGGTYFRPISSSVTGQSYTSEEAMHGLPAKWFKGLDVGRMVTSKEYNDDVNTYKVSCGQGLREWEASGWISSYDPYGWFQWYCRFYLGRRCPDDERQIKRGLGVMGDKGRWKRFLINKCLQSQLPLEEALANRDISPKVRQLLQHWGYEVTLHDLELARKTHK